MASEGPGAAVLPAVREADTALLKAAAGGHDLPAAAFEEAADRVFVMNALARLSLYTGWAPTPERLAAVASYLVARGYTRAQIALAVNALAEDEELNRALRFPEGTVTPADFRRVIDAPDGPAARARLYTHAEAVDLYSRRYHTPGGPTFTDVFEKVERPGEPRPLWRLR